MCLVTPFDTCPNWTFNVQRPPRRASIAEWEAVSVYLLPIQKRINDILKPVELSLDEVQPIMKYHIESPGPGLTMVICIFFVLPDQRSILCPGLRVRALCIRQYDVMSCPRATRVPELRIRVSNSCYRPFLKEGTHDLTSQNDFTPSLSSQDLAGEVASGTQRPQLNNLGPVLGSVTVYVNEIADRCARHFPLFLLTNSHCIF